MNVTKSRFSWTSSTLAHNNWSFTSNLYASDSKNLVSKIVLCAVLCKLLCSAVSMAYNVRGASSGMLKINALSGHRQGYRDTAPNTLTKKIDVCELELLDWICHVSLFSKWVTMNCGVGMKFSNDHHGHCARLSGCHIKSEGKFRLHFTMSNMRNPLLGFKTLRLYFLKCYFIFCCRPAEAPLMRD